MVNDPIDRQAVLRALKDAFDKYEDKVDIEVELIASVLKMPSTPPESLSDAYMKAVWTWLLDYQIKAAELKGRYTPYEVLSWVANDWRKEHE